jgi:hypothetical protein
LDSIVIDIVRPDLALIVDAEELRLGEGRVGSRAVHRGHDPILIDEAMAVAGGIVVQPCDGAVVVDLVGFDIGRARDVDRDELTVGGGPAASNGPTVRARKLQCSSRDLFCIMANSYSSLRTRSDRTAEPTVD